VVDNTVLTRTNCGVTTLQDHVLSPLEVPCVFTTVNLRLAPRTTTAVLRRVFLGVFQTRNWWTSREATYTTTVTTADARHPSTSAAAVKSLVLRLKRAFSSGGSVLIGAFLLLRVEGIFGDEVRLFVPIPSVG
jgi:hypothetical protein